MLDWTIQIKIGIAIEIEKNDTRTRKDGQPEFDPDEIKAQIASGDAGKPCP